MTKQTTAWKYGSNKDTNAGRNGNQGKNRAGNNNKEKDMKFATQEQMSNGYYGTYNTVKEIIINEVQKKYEYGCDMAQAIRAGKAFDINTVKPTRGQRLKPMQKRDDMNKAGWILCTKRNCACTSIERSI